MRTFVYRIAFPVALLHLSGCYAFAPVAVPDRELEGEKVRVHLSDAGLSEVTPRLGPGVLTVEGDVLGTRADSLIVAVTTVRTRTRGDLFWNGETVPFSRPAIEQLEARRLSRWRTAGAVIALAGAGFWLGSGILGGDTVEPGGGGPGGGPVQ